MSDKSAYKDIDIQLELKDRINYTYIMQTTLLLIKRYMSKEDIDPNKLEDMLFDFLTDIPHDWYDEFFLDDVKTSFIKKKVDIRPLWGEVKLSLNKCIKLGLPIEKTLNQMNPYLLKNAIINLLHRRDMLVRKKKIEYSTGKNLNIETLDDLAVYDDEEIENIETVDDNIEREIKELENKDEE